MTVDFDGRQYQFAVNGQTGEASGQVPTSGGADMYDRLSGRLSGFGGFSKVIPLIVILACAAILFPLVQSDSIGVFKTIVIAFLCLCELAALLFVMLTKILGFSRSVKPHQTAYETNDFDEDPGLDSYFDSTRHSDLKVDETLLRHIVKITDENGNVIHEHSVEI